MFTVVGVAGAGGVTVALTLPAKVTVWIPSVTVAGVAATVIEVVAGVALTVTSSLAAG